MNRYFLKVRSLAGILHKSKANPELQNEPSVKDYTLDGDDREEWNDAWSKQSHRKLELPINVDGIHSLNELESGYGKMLSATISEDPVEFSDFFIHEINGCPVCGEETIAMERISASIHPEFQNGLRNISIGVWVHKSCFQICSVIDGPAPIPW